MSRVAALDDPLFDDLFMSCAFHAYLDEARRTGGPPDSEAVRRRAYRDYEAALPGRRRPYLPADLSTL